MGFVWGAANTASITIVSENVTPAKQGSIIGTIFTSWNVSGAIFLAIFSGIFSHQQIKHLDNYLKQKSQSITTVQLQELNKAIHDPDHAIQILHQHKIPHANIKNINTPYKIFSDGFLYALTYGSTIMVILLLILIISIITLWFKINKKHI